MSDARLAAALNGFSDCAFIVDSRRRLAAANDAARAAFGAPPIGQDFVRVVRRPEALALLDRALRGEGRVGAELTLDGPLSGPHRVTAAPLPGGGAVISFADLSALHAAERMRSDFVANVSHELRSPLTALVGFIETLQGPAREDAAARTRFLALMEREAARMTRLIQDLLSLSRVEVDARVRPTAPVDLGAVLRRVVATLNHVAAAEDVAVALAAPDAPVVAPGDEDQLTQVFHNLIENALKYAAGGKRIEISLREVPSAPGIAGPAARIDVRDHGPGIAREHLPRLTERFYRVDTGRSRDKGGTGLGLAIAKHIVQRHRGRLEVESAAGAGACFTVILPLSA